MKTNIYPELHPQESFRGYLIRLRQINSFDLKPQKTRRCMSSVEIRLLAEAEHELLSALAGRLPVDIKQEEKRYEYETTVCFNSFVSRGLVTNKRRICPQCLIDAPYQRLSWEIVLFNTCTIHNTYLVEQCDCCCRPLSWTDSFVSRCRCGFDLRNSKKVEAQKYISLAEQITQLQFPAVSTEWCPYPLEFHPLLRLGLEETFRLVSFLRDSSIIEDYALVLRDTSRVISPQQQLLADALTNWPVGFSKVCTNLLEYHLRESSRRAKNPIREFERRLYQRYPIHFLINHPALNVYRGIEKSIVRKLSIKRLKEVV